MQATAQIHPSAIIEEGAQIGPGCRIGAYAYVGANVQMGAECVIHHHATVDGHTEMGDRNEVFPYAYIGAKTHDLKYTGGTPRLSIGSGNTFREYVSVHLATNDEEYTRLGDNNVLLAYSHVAHDCQIGNGMVMSSHAAIGGHCMIEDKVVIGWSAGIHQFCRVGAYAMVGASSKVVQDVPPYLIADGNPAKVRTFNKVGLERGGFDADQIRLAKDFYRITYRQNHSRQEAIAAIEARAAEHPTIAEPFLAFLKASERGLA